MHRTTAAHALMRIVGLFTTVLLPEVHYSYVYIGCEARRKGQLRSDDSYSYPARIESSRRDPEKGEVST